MQFWEKIHKNEAHTSLMSHGIRSCLLVFLKNKPATVELSRETFIEKCMAFCP
jgi:hypothetical protein